jgi:hypothetical protein
MARQSCHGSRMIINYGVLWSSESLSGAQKLRGTEKTWRTVHYLLGRHNKWAKAQVVARNDKHQRSRIALHGRAAPNNTVHSSAVSTYTAITYHHEGAGIS